MNVQVHADADQRTKISRPPVCETRERHASDPQRRSESTSMSIAPSQPDFKVRAAKKLAVNKRKRGKIPFYQVLRTLASYGLAAGQLSVVWGCAYTTSARRLQDPGLITLRELVQVSDQAGIPLDELLAAVGK